MFFKTGMLLSSTHLCFLAINILLNIGIYEFGACLCHLFWHYKFRIMANRIKIRLSCKILFGFLLVILNKENF